MTGEGFAARTRKPAQTRRRRQPLSGQFFQQYADCSSFGMLHCYFTDHFTGWLIGRKITKLTLRTQYFDAGFSIFTQIMPAQYFACTHQSSIAIFLRFSIRIKTVKNSNMCRRENRLHRSGRFYNYPVLAALLLEIPAHDSNQFG